MLLSLRSIFFIIPFDKKYTLVVFTTFNFNRKRFELYGLFLQQTHVFCRFLYALRRNVLTLIYRYQQTSLKKNGIP
jgi:hypothetical protein